MKRQNVRCGECGERKSQLKNVKGIMTTPWKDYPVAYVTKDLELLVCHSCGNIIISGEDTKKVDTAVEASVRDQTAQFIDIIKSKGQISVEDLAGIIGVSYQYLSSLHTRNKTPSFQLWNLLKVMTISPNEMIRMLDPNFDIRKENILLRA